MLFISRATVVHFVPIVWDAKKISLRKKSGLSHIKQLGDLPSIISGRNSGPALTCINDPADEDSNLASNFAALR
jgi:hypothetical protein